MGLSTKFQVAETLINPFGEDDDDFELNRLVGNTGVDWILDVRFYKLFRSTDISRWDS